MDVLLTCGAVSHCGPSTGEETPGTPEICDRHIFKIIVMLMVTFKCKIIWITIVVIT